METDIGGLVAQLDLEALEMALQLIQLAEQTLQRGPAAEINDFTSAFVEGRAMVLGIVDIEADVKYVRGWGRRYMRYRTAEKREIIDLVERSSLPVRRTLDCPGIPKSTFYSWYERYPCH